MIWAAAIMYFFGFSVLEKLQYLQLHPLTALNTCISMRGSEMGPFLQRLDGQPLTKGHFTAKVREALNAVGLPEENFAGHSF